MRPDFGLGAQPFHRAVEHLDHQFEREHLVLNAAGGRQMNLRLLDLDHRAAGVGELGIFFVERLGDGEHALGQRLVVSVLRRERDDLRRHGAEFHRTRGQPLCGLPQCGVLQVAAPDRADNDRHHPRFQIIVQDVAARKPETAAPGRRRPRVAALVAGHVMRRIAGPALAANVVVEAAIAVGDDVEASELLLAQIAGQARRYIARGSGGSPSRRGTCGYRDFPVYQLGRGSEPVIVVGSMMSFVARYIAKPPKISVAPRFPAARGFTQSFAALTRLYSGSRLSSKTPRRQWPRARSTRFQIVWALAPEWAGVSIGSADADSVRAARRQRRPDDRSRHRAGTCS